MPRRGRLSRPTRQTPSRGIRQFVTSSRRNQVLETSSDSSDSGDVAVVNEDNNHSEESQDSRRVPLNLPPDNEDSDEVVLVNESEPEDEDDEDYLVETESDGSLERNEIRVISALASAEPDPELSQLRNQSIQDVVANVGNVSEENDTDDDVIPLRLVRRQRIEPTLSELEDGVEVLGSERSFSRVLRASSSRATTQRNVPSVTPSSSNSETAGGFFPASGSENPSTSSVQSSLTNQDPEPEDEGRQNNDNDQNEDEGNHDDDPQGPNQKKPRLDISSRSDEEDGCGICYEPYENSGEHRPCCLKCGHLFGKNCIDRWIKTQKRCPACNCKAMPKDVRIIYVKNLKAIDNAELERAKGDIDKLKIEKNKLELSNAQLRCRLQALTQELDRTKSENQLRVNQGTSDISQQPSTSTKAFQGTSSAPAAFPALRMPKLELKRNFPIKEGSCRVGANDDWSNLMVVSHSLNSALFPNGSFAIKKFNTAIMKPFQSFPIHQKPIRDMSFSPLQHELLLTVGLDKKAALFNTNSNCIVQTFETETPLWSCCWNTVSQYYFYVGAANGAISVYDIRAPQAPTKTLTLPTTDRSAVVRLKFVPPSYQNQPFNMSGLLIQKMNSVWFGETLGGAENDPRYHQLPLEGPFFNVDFEETSRHVLVSSRPKVTGNQRIPTVHTICNLGKKFSEAEGNDLFSCDIIQVMNGGFQEGSMLCRSTLFSPQEGHIYVAGNGESSKTVRIWDVANIEQKALIRINREIAMDFVHWKINDVNSLGIITDSAMDVYEVK